MHFSAAALLALVPAVLGHGLITTPPSRAVGDAILADCGNGVTKRKPLSYIFCTSRCLSLASHPILTHTTTYTTRLTSPRNRRRQHLPRRRPPRSRRHRQSLPSL